jgi:hypothetical protein
MEPAVPLSQKELIDLLNKCWMTHDGMWFYHCFREFGIDAANRLNHAAISSLAPLEVARIRKALGIQKERLETFEEFQFFFLRAAELFIPEFMQGKMSFPRRNILHWEFSPGQCFAYKGMRRIGAIDGYRCGVMYRVKSWIESLGIRCRLEPEVGGCLMLLDGRCSGDIELFLP